MLPSRSHPHGVLTRRHFPAAWFPNVSAAIPAMITTDPNMLRARPVGTALHFYRGWFQFNHHLSGIHRTDAHCGCNKPVEKKFLHDCLLPYLLCKRVAGVPFLTREDRRHEAPGSCPRLAFSGDIHAAVDGDEIDRNSEGE